MPHTPGTPEWLRLIAREPNYKAIAEGLIRAANRIDRLASAYRNLPIDSLNTIASAMNKAQQGVLTTPTAGVPVRAQGKPAPVSFTFRIATLDTDMDNLPEWVNGSANMGIGYLDPAKIVLESDPDKEGSVEVNYKYKDMALLLDKDSGTVVLRGPTKTVVLEKTVAVKWEMKESKGANLAILELRAQKAELV